MKIIHDVAHQQTNFLKCKRGGK